MGEYEEQRHCIHKKNKRAGAKMYVMICAVLCIFLVGCAQWIRLPKTESEAEFEAAAGEEAVTKTETASGEESCPDSLEELAESNPETEDFVKNYAEKKNQKGKIEISEDLTGEIPLFLQWDERWGYRKYGEDYMAVNGCGPTCLSMVWCGLTGKTKWNPYEVAKMAEKKGFYVKGAGSAWGLMTEGAVELGLVVETVIFDEAHIVDTLKEGNPIICVVGPGDFTTQGHFLVLTGVDDSGKIKIHDPNSKKNSKKTWKISRLKPQIKNLWAYRIP